MRIGRLLLIMLGIVLLRGVSPAGENSPAPSQWPKESFTKRIGLAASVDTRSPLQFLLDRIFWNGERLKGNCTYHNTGSFPAGVDGKEIAEKSATEAEFYPDLLLQVSNDVVEGWKTVGTSPSPGQGKAITVSMAPRGAIEEMIKSEANRSCFVEMDSFRPFIGKFMYGRMTLRNGVQSQVFALDDLLPPVKGVRSN